MQLQWLDWFILGMQHIIVIDLLWRILKELKKINERG